jgi:hypothetical protein
MRRWRRFSCGPGDKTSSSHGRGKPLASEIGEKGVGLVTGRILAMGHVNRVIDIPRTQLRRMISNRSFHLGSTERSPRKLLPSNHVGIKHMLNVKKNREKLT